MVGFFPSSGQGHRNPYPVTLLSSMQLSRFHSLSSSSWDKMARARGVCMGALYEPVLEGHMLHPATSCRWELSHIVIVPAECKGRQEIQPSCVPRKRRDYSDQQLARLCHAADTIGEIGQQSKCVGSGMNGRRSWAGRMSDTHCRYSVKIFCNPFEENWSSQSHKQLSNRVIFFFTEEQKKYCRNKSFGLFFF